LSKFESSDEEELTSDEKIEVEEMPRMELTSQQKLKMFSEDSK